MGRVDDGVVDDLEIERLPLMIGAGEALPKLLSMKDSRRARNRYSSHLASHCRRCCRQSFRSMIFTGLPAAPETADGKDRWCHAHDSRR